MHTVQVPGHSKLLMGHSAWTCRPTLPSGACSHQSAAHMAANGPHIGRSCTHHLVPQRSWLHRSPAAGVSRAAAGDTAGSRAATPAAGPRATPSAPVGPALPPPVEQQGHRLLAEAQLGLPWWQHLRGTLSVAAVAAVLLLCAPGSLQAAPGGDALPLHHHQGMLATAAPASAPASMPLTPAAHWSARRISPTSTLTEEHNAAQLTASRSLQEAPEQPGAASEIALAQATVSGLASEMEDKLLEVVRQLEARVDNALGVVQAGGPRASQEEQEELNRMARTLVSEVWDVVDQNYLDARATGWDRAQWQALRDEALSRQYADTAAVYRAIKDMMARGLSDPYCRFITPSELSAMKKYDVTGIGLNLGTSAEFVLKTGRQLPPSYTQGGDESGVFVVGISKGSPADKAGVRQGDELTAVDDMSLAETSPFQAASLIAGQQVDGDDSTGKQKPYVKLQVRRADGRESSITVDRPVRVLSSPVQATLVKIGDEPVGVLKLTSFNARAQRDLTTAIARVTDAGAQSLVLDLRDNRGGLVSEGLEVARLFLQGDAPIVFTESRSMSREVPRAVGPAMTQLPLTVLVNEHTASASEIVAGALHDNCRAVLVGGRTYGKGLIQSVYELSDGSGMVLTVGKYLTPNRTDIDRSGIQPDFVTRPTSRLAADTLNACRVSAKPAFAAARAS